MSARRQSFKGLRVRGPVSKTQSVIWREISGKKISIAGGSVEICVVLVVGESRQNNSPIFCLNIKEQQPDSDWHSHSITLNKSEAEWVLENIDHLTLNDAAKHKTENKSGDTVRSLRVILKKSNSGKEFALFSQIKSGKEDKVKLPASKLITLKKYIAQAIQEFDTFTEKAENSGDSSDDEDEEEEEEED